MFSDTENEDTHTIAIALKQNGAPWTKQLGQFLRARQRSDRIAFIPNNQNFVRKLAVPRALITFNRSHRPSANDVKRERVVKKLELIQQAEREAVD